MNTAKASTAKPKAQGRVGYRDILDFMLVEINRGRWEVGSAIISEADLVNQFGTTRTTVRQALKELETQGYIKRRRGTRSILISAEPSADFVNSVRSIGELLQYSQRTNSRLIGSTRVITGDALAERLGVAAGREWLRVDYLRMPQRGGLPLGYSEIYVDRQYAAVEADLVDDRTVYSLLEEKYGVSICRVEQELQAAAADGRVAELLKVAPGSPIMVVRTLFINGAGAIVEVGMGHFPAGRFRFEMVLERSGAGQLE